MKTAVIGLGVIGKVHVDILLDKKYDLVAVCDDDVAKKSLYPDLKFYTDFKLMIEKERPDVVHVCTPHYLHKEMIIYCLKRNVNVLCEKPLCINKNEIQEILDAEEKSKAILGVCFQNRYLPQNVFLKEYLKDKKVTSAVSSLAWNRGKEYYAQGAWRGTKDQEGGGVLINQGIHTLDLLTYLLGEPEFVTAYVSNLRLKGVIEVEDTATIVCSGKTNFIMFATNASVEYFSIDTVIKTENETIRVFDDKVVINGEFKDFSNHEKLYGKACYGSGHGALIEDFYRCVKSGTKFSIDGKEAVKSLKIVLSAYESNGNKIEISI